MGRALLLLVFLHRLASAYSVLTHEAIIDAAWEDTLRPLLLQRFPRATEDDLRKAHACAYGGAIIQDLGYYPFGSHLFSDLVHYARSGDFIANLIASAADLNEYAFALGSLAHYAADTNGHSIAVNRAVPLLYPKLRRRFGEVVTYEDNPTAHVRTEFGFDVAQVAQHRYASQAYHDFIGFDVSKSVLERAFQQTFALELKEILASEDLALGTYRHAVGSVIPNLTKVAWNTNRKELAKAAPGLTRSKFVYNLSRSNYRKEWGASYERPKLRAQILGVLLRVIPKVGPLKALSFRPPTPEAQRLFMDSLNRTLAAYKGLLAQARGQEVLRLENRNLDTGDPSGNGRYRLADEAYAQLLEKLSSKQFAAVDERLRANILAFYRSAPPTDAKAMQNLMALKAAQ